ncbi:type III-B CRISPR module RAMP protein Cmr4 [Aerosakkonema funiforme]|uniref:type III-B CRISPR module RAMP protein Cmr4 n=1 Tax=Aerosakkonema funiforme TaxID=1246630 RepID=UPI0035BB3C14
MNYLTYSYLLTPLHTGASSQAGNMMGIAREAQTELPYLPSSSLRGKIRSVLESMHPNEAGLFFGERIKDGNQPTEGEVWFVDATLLLFPIASYSHQYVWITCPLWLSRWNRWLKNSELDRLIATWRSTLAEDTKKAIASVRAKQIYLQGALLTENEIEPIDTKAACWDCFKSIPNGNGILELQQKLVILTDDDCAAFVEMGLQREVRIALEKEEKIVFGGSFRSEEAIPSETILFFPWGMKPNKDEQRTENVRNSIIEILNDRLQFGGLEGLGRGWTENKTVTIDNSKETK